MPPPTQRPTYFVPANFDFPPPPDGPIKLGQLIAHPESPGQVVDPAGPVPFEGFEGIRKYTNSTRFSLQRRDASESEIGLFGRALQAMSVKLSLSISRAAVSYVLNDIDKLDVEFIEPTDDYVKASVDRPKVKEALKAHLFRKRLYMVTGIKTAYPGAKLDRRDGSDTRIVGEAGASAPQGVGNAGVEGHAKFSASELHTLALIPMKPFVYGYRLQECYFRFGRMRRREYVDGALFGVGSEAVEPIDDDEGLEIEVEFDCIEQEDVRGWDTEDGENGEDNFEIVTVADEFDGSTCDVILPMTN